MLRWHSINQQLVDLTGETKTVTEKLSRAKTVDLFL